MANQLTGQLVNTKGDVLHVSNSGSGIDGTLRTVYDGAGNASILKLSTSYVYVGNVTFNGNTVSTTSGALVFSPAITFNGAVTFNSTVSELTVSNPFNAGSYAVTLGGNLTTSSTVSITGAFTTAAAFTTSGANALTLTTTGSTNVTFPTSGTLCTTAGSSSIATVGTITSGTWNGSTVGVAYGGTGLTSATAYAVLVGGTTSTGAFQSIASVGTSGQVLTSNGPGAKPTFQSVTNSTILVQRVYSAVSGSSGTSTIPYDNTIPQNTEGSQIGSATITPTNSSNKLRIRFSGHVGNSATNAVILALFQDSTASAIAASIVNFSVPDTYVNFEYEMAAGTTSSTTFYLRIGDVTTGTWTVGSTGALVSLGGVMPASLTVEEFTP